MDKPISFFVVAVPYERTKEVEFRQGKIYTKEEIEKLDLGYLKLEITPRGKGELKVNANQLYFTSLPGEKIEVPLEILNEGSRRLDNIEFELDLPINWTKEIKPQIIESLDIRKDKRVVITFTPPNDVPVGKYDIRLRTTCISDEKLVKAEDKTITIEVKQSENIFGTILLVLLIIGLVSVIVVFGIKLSRK
ncbi:MAG: hypothetical protein C4517_03095 [Stygiobacter sp.]|nr:MAG: hypothetical protein C4517_03095 [Stygiobacter sp.]